MASTSAKRLSNGPAQAPLTGTPLPYRMIHALFRFVLAIFFSHVVVENLSNLPPNGQPTLLLANHSNSLTDALILMASVPKKRRRMLRMTAKATHFRRGNFSSWLIEKAGSVPLMRAKDYDPQSGVKVDNKAVMEMLNGAIEGGDAVAMFPEGISRYHPQVAPLKTGAARIAADVLSRQHDNPDFELTVVTCSITYLHRQHFRSDVLVSFNPPLTIRSSSLLANSLSDPDPEARKESVKLLTDQLAEQIRSGTLDSPSWDLVRVAHTARRLYAPMGTEMSLGEHVRLTQRFIDGFAGKKALRRWDELAEDRMGEVLKTPMARAQPGDDGTEYFRMGSVDGHSRNSSVDADMRAKDVDDLAKDLRLYQNDLVKSGIKDDRVRNNRLLHRRIILKRLFVRLAGAAFLLCISVPGLCLWLPVFLTTRHFAEKQKRKGPVWDTYDEITQTKLLYGLASGIAVYFICVITTLPFFPITTFAVPLVMWLSLRWFEDMVASARAALALFYMLRLGQPELTKLRHRRDDLRRRTILLATSRCGLPEDAEALLMSSSDNATGKRKGRGRLSYFSIRRRRKKDYQEVLKLFDSTEYPEDELVET